MLSEWEFAEKASWFWPMNRVNVVLWCEALHASPSDFFVSIREDTRAHIPSAHYLRVAKYYMHHLALKNIDSTNNIKRPASRCISTELSQQVPTRSTRRNYSCEFHRCDHHLPFTTRNPFVSTPHKHPPQQGLHWSKMYIIQSDTRPLKRIPIFSLRQHSKTSFNQIWARQSGPSHYQPYTTYKNQLYSFLFFHPSV